MKSRLLLLVLILSTVFTGCKKDDDDKKDDVQLSKSILVGKWNVTAYATDGDFETLPDGYIYINVKDDNNYTVKFLTNTYVGKYTIKENTMVGITLDPITEYFKFDELNGNTALISYSNNDGDSYKFKATKEDKE